MQYTNGPCNRMIETLHYAEHQRSTIELQLWILRLSVTSLTSSEIPALALGTQYVFMKQ